MDWDKLQKLFDDRSKILESLKITGYAESYYDSWITISAPIGSGSGDAVRDLVISKTKNKILIEDILLSTKVNYLRKLDEITNQIEKCLNDSNIVDFTNK